MAAPGGALAQLIQQMGAGGVAGPRGMVPGAPGAPPGGGGEAAAPGLGKMASELRGSDPALILKALTLNKQQLSQLFVMASQSLPNVAGNIAKTMIQIDRAIKEAQQAAATQSVVRQPISFSPVSLGTVPGQEPGGMT